MSAPEFKRASFTSAVIYKDATAGRKFLEDAFGFEVAMLVTDDKGGVGHCEMRFGDSLIMIGYEWNESSKSPSAIGGANTQTVHVHLNEGIDRHCERARNSGAEILQEPADQFYGDRTYRARDPEGHVWTFGQTVRVLTPEQMSDGTGFKVTIL